MKKSWNCVFEFLWEPCYTQFKCRPYVGGETQTSNFKALLTEPLRPLVMGKKNITGGL